MFRPEGPRDNATRGIMTAYRPFDSYVETIYRLSRQVRRQRPGEAMSIVYIACNKFANVKLASQTDDSETNWDRYYTLDDLRACEPACYAYASCTTVEQLITILRARPDWLAWCKDRSEVEFPADLKEAIDYIG